jgi:hypothetical protein
MNISQSIDLFFLLIKLIFILFIFLSNIFRIYFRIFPSSHVKSNVVTISLIFLHLYLFSSNLGLSFTPYNFCKTSYISLYFFSNNPNIYILIIY